MLKYRVGQNDEMTNVRAFTDFNISLLVAPGIICGEPFIYLKPHNAGKPDNYT